MKLQLKQIRRKSRVSQEELAKMIGVSARAIGAWERGENSPNIEQVWNCADVLGCTPNDICGWYIDHPEDRPTEDPNERSVLTSYGMLSEEGREVAAGVMAGLAHSYPQGRGEHGLDKAEA